MGHGAHQEAEEILSYRTALLLILGGVAIMWWWLWRSGMPAWAAGLTIFMSLVIFIGVTRMVTEGGFFITRAPMNTGNFMVSGFGVESLGPAGVTATGYTFVWAGEMRIFVMVACAGVAVGLGCARARLFSTTASLPVISRLRRLPPPCHRGGGPYPSITFPILPEVPPTSAPPPLPAKQYD